tara:strand:- start:6273 stop:7220 length:948 start_codon:yes stop_codon:yes gene_type:complete
VLQSLLSLYQVELQYVSLIVFSLLCLPALIRLNIITTTLIYVVVLIQLLKVLFIGIGPEYAKAGSLIIFTAILITLGPKLFIEDLLCVLKRLRWIILMIGAIYVACWIPNHTYRNASTFSLFIMTFLGFRGPMFISSFAFLSFAKTLFQLLFPIALIGGIMKSIQLRKILVITCILSALITPIILSQLLDDDMIIISQSHTSSLFERLYEVRVLTDNMHASPINYLIGDRVGWVLESAFFAERGYVHSTHLFLIRTYGIPIWIIGMVLLLNNATRGNNKVFTIKVLIIISQAFLQTLFTSAFLTMILFSSSKYAR